MATKDSTMKTASFFKLVRFPNLLIVALTQYLLQYLVLTPALDDAGLLPILDPFHFFLLVFTTVLIATGGYLINDILDYESDLINKPAQVYVNRVFPLKSVLAFYVSTVLVGFVIAWYLAGYVENRLLVSIYPAAVALLYFYSKNLKQMPLVGNVVVAVFCAFVAGVVLFADRKNFGQLSGQGSEAGVFFGGYLLFAFLSTLFREIIKDMEDLEGDRQLGLQTLPIKIGIEKSKLWANGIGVALLISLLVFVNWLIQHQFFLCVIFTIASVVWPLGYTIFLVKNATVKQSFSKASLWAKIVMLAGLLLLIFCKLVG